MFFSFRKTLFLASLLFVVILAFSSTFPFVPVVWFSELSLFFFIVFVSSSLIFIRNACRIGEKKTIFVFSVINVYVRFLKAKYVYVLRCYDVDAYFSLSCPTVDSLEFLPFAY